MGGRGEKGDWEGKRRKGRAEEREGGGEGESGRVVGVVVEIFIVIEEVPEKEDLEEGT